MSEEKEYPKAGETWMDFFQRKKRFADLILLAWGIMEFDVYQLLARELGLDRRDRKVQSLFDRLDFEDKIQFLKKNNVFTKEEFSTIKEFKKYRNKLFHGKDWAYFIRSEPELKQWINVATEACRVIRDILILGSEHSRTHEVIKENKNV